jgi:hypothetical protein
MKKVIAIFILLSIAAAIFLMSGEATEEEKIEAVLLQVRDGIEAEELSKAMSGFSENYRDESGATHDAIKGVLLRQFLKNKPSTIRLSPMVIAVKDDTAQADFEAVPFEGEDVSIFAVPHESDVISFSVQLVKQEGDWLIVSHTRQVGPSEPN